MRWMEKNMQDKLEPKRMRNVFPNSKTCSSVQIELSLRVWFPANGHMLSHTPEQDICQIFWQERDISQWALSIRPIYSNNHDCYFEAIWDRFISQFTHKIEVCPWLVRFRPRSQLHPNSPACEPDHVSVGGWKRQVRVRIRLLHVYGSSAISSHEKQPWISSP